MSGVFEAAAVERDQALVAAHVGALVDGHGEMAVAQQRAGMRASIFGLAESRGVVARIGAQAIRRLIVHDQERHRTVGLGLENEAALELQRGAKQRGQHDGLAEQLADRRGIIVLGQDFVERRTKPHQPTAHIERVDLVRQHGVIDRNRGWRANRAFRPGFHIRGLGNHGALSGVGRRNWKG
ncbi:hypothetical protein ACVWZV_001190 [Bradyrhizobium sp. GM5.1]